MGVEDAQSFTAGDVVELANLLSEVNRLRTAVGGSTVRRGLFQFPYRGHFTTGRGRTVYSFQPEDLPAVVQHPRDLLGSEIAVGLVRVRVVGVEHWAIICPRGDERCEHTFGLEVER